MMEEIDSLYQKSERLIARTPDKFHRYLLDEIDWNDKLIGIKGARGCGKSTLLRQRLKRLALPSVLYVSMDDLWFVEGNIMDVAEYHFQHGGTHLFIDEIHHLRNWQLVLKNLSDLYPEMWFVYTGSSMLKIDHSRGDLSRRQRLYTLHEMSFREFLEYEYGYQIGPFDLADLTERHAEIAGKVCTETPILPKFEAYLSHGCYPFYQVVSSGYHDRLQEVINVVIENDFPAVEDVTPATIRKTKRMLLLLAEKVPQTPNMSELYATLETDRNQGLKMLNALERSGLLRLLSSVAKNLKNLVRPDKIYLGNTNLMYALSARPDKGTLRETFFMNQLSQSHQVNYPAKGDFLVDQHLLFEVGGRHKTFEQIKDIPDSFLAVDDTDVGIHNRIPLWMFGLLY